jgi:WD40 repeat protein
MRFLRGHSKSVHSVAYAPYGRTLASGDAAGVIHLWDRATHQIAQTLTGHTDTVWRLLFPRDGQTLISAGFDGAIYVWYLAMGRPRWGFVPGDNQVRALLLDSTERYLYTGVWNPPYNNSFLLRCYDLLTENVRGVRSRLLNDIWAMRLTQIAWVEPDHRLLIATDSYRGSLVVLDLQTDTWEILVPSYHRIPDLLMLETAPAPLAAVAVNNDIQLWDVATPELQGVLQGHDDWVQTLALTPDRRYLLSAGRDRTVRLWDLAERRQVRAWDWDIEQVWSLAVAPDGQTAAAAGDDGSVLVWDLDV